MGRFLRSLQQSLRRTPPLLIVLAIVAALLAAGVASYVAITGGSPEPVPTQTPAVTATPTAAGSATATMTPTQGPPAAQIDTSAWLSHTSPEGFTFRYPPDWTVVEGLPNLRAVSPESAQAIAEEFPGRRPGMAEFGLFIDAGPFDAEAIIENCERPPALSLPTERPDTASEVIFLGHRAVKCVQSGITRSIQTRWEWLSLAYIIELSPDSILTAYGYVVPEGAIQFPLLEAIFGESSLAGTQ